MLGQEDAEQETLERLRTYAVVDAVRPCVWPGDTFLESLSAIP